MDEIDIDGMYRFEILDELRPKLPPQFLARRVRAFAFLEPEHGKEVQG